MPSPKVLFLTELLLIILLYSSEIKVSGSIANYMNNLRTDIFDFQSSIGDRNQSKENLTEIILSLSSFLMPLLKELESSAKLQQKFTADLDELSSQINDTSCSLSKRLIEIENEVSALKGDQVQQTTHQMTDKSKATLDEEDLFLTPSSDYVSARRYCYVHQGKPFVPKTQEHVNLIAERTIQRTDEFGWIPLTDIVEEGIGEWNDGTQYGSGPLKLVFTDDTVNDGNAQSFDCVDVNSEGHTDWYKCDIPRRMLCVRL